jgi:tetratricopeptide (TPR) repeat protein
MAETPDGVQTRLEEQIPEASGLLEVLDQSLRSTESVEYALVTTHDLVCDDETEIPIADGGTGVVVATDRRLLFGFETPDGERVRAVLYTDLREILAEDGLFRSTLTIEVWAEGVYKFRPSDGASMTNLASFVSDVSEDWQRVVATLEDCQEITTTLREDLEAGRGQAARNRGDELERTLAKARTQAEASDHRVQSALDERIQTTRAECHETWMAARIERAGTLIEEAKQQTDASAYAEAYRRYERARAHLERALIDDIEYGFDRAQQIQTLIDTVDARLADLAVRPMAVAHQARERAGGTDRPAVAVENWQTAFEQYRMALTAGWGTDIDFADTDILRERIEQTVRALIDARRRYAKTLESAGDSDRSDGDTEAACKQYRQARDQIDAALSLSREFRGGDTATLRRRFERLDTKVETTRSE